MAFKSAQQPPTGISPDNLSLLARWARDIWGVVNGMLAGKLNATLDITLLPNTDTTVLLDPRFSGSSFIGLQALSDSAAVELGSGLIYPVAQGAETLTLKHANSPDVDRTLRLLIIG